MDDALYRLVFFALCVVAISACGEKTYPNIDPLEYVYSVPESRDDGIEVASISDIGADEDVLTEMIRNRLRMHFRNIDSVLVYKNNKLILEEYFSGYSIDQPHDLRSATKSITSLLAGIAMQQGIIDSENLKVFPVFDGDYSQLDNWVPEKASIELRHLLNMNSGLDCDDDNPLSPGNESRMYRERDWYKFLLEQRQIFEPGEQYAYCTAGVHLIGGIIRKLSGESITEFSRQNLFSRLGITDFQWSKTPLDIEDAGGHIYLRPRDMLKIGIMMLKQGQWAGEQVVPQTWVEKSQVKTYPDYGYLWWKWTSEFDEEQNIPDVDVYYASGNGGQKIFVVPSENLVVAITGSNFNHWQGFWGPIHMLHFYIIPATHGISE